jgi:hypothetical protein
MKLNKTQNILNIVIAFTIALNPIVGLQSSYAEGPDDNAPIPSSSRASTNPTPGLDYSSAVTGTKGEKTRVITETVVADTREEVAEGLIWVKRQQGGLTDPNAPAEVHIEGLAHTDGGLVVIDATEEGSPEAAMLDELRQSPALIGDHYRKLEEDEKNVFKTSEKRSLWGKFRDFATGKILTFSQKPKIVRIAFSTVRLAGVGAASTFAFIHMGHSPLVSLMTGVGLSGGFTFLIQFFGDQYGKFMSDPTVLTQIRKGATKGFLKVTGQSDKIETAMKLIDESAVTKKLNSMPLVNGLTVYNITEWAILIPILIITQDLAPLAFMWQLIYSSTQAMASQGVTDYAISEIRRSQMLEVLRNADPNFEAEMAAIPDQMQREEFFARRLDKLMMHPESQAELDGAKTVAVAKFLHQFKMLALAMVSNAAVFLGTSSDPKIRELNFYAIAAIGVFGGALLIRHRYNERVIARLNAEKAAAAATTESTAAKCGDLLSGRSEFPKKKRTEPPAKASGF